MRWTYVIQTNVNWLAVRVDLDEGRGNLAVGVLRYVAEYEKRWARFARHVGNNIVEQDHRAIKQRCASMLAFNSAHTAAVTFLINRSSGSYPSRRTSAATSDRSLLS